MKSTREGAFQFLWKWRDSKGFALRVASQQFPFYVRFALPFGKPLDMDCCEY